MTTENGAGALAAEPAESVVESFVPTPVTEKAAAPVASTAAKAAKALKAKAPVKQTVNILLDANVHQYFAKLAAEDERTLSQYLARLIKQVYATSSSSTVTS
jgi:hypothetical protein